MTIQTLHLAQNLLAGNDVVAARNRAQLEAAGVLAINLIASPGAGKTSLVCRTVQALQGQARVGVIEGDIASSLDAERALAAGARAAIQINTGGGCHLEAHMVERALDNLDLAALDVLFIENVGNLVCPNHWALGEHFKLCLASTAEGDDKPVKYPEIFAASDVLVLNKLDLAPHVDFDRERFYRDVRVLNPDAPAFEVSCRTGAGLETWADWVLDQRLSLAVPVVMNTHA